MDFRITLDITERFADALNALVRIVQNISIQAARTAISEPLAYSAGASDAQPIQTAPAPIAEAEPVVIPHETEIAPTGAVQPQETALTENPANDDAPAVEPIPEKPKKKKAQKKPVEASEPAPEPEAPVTQPAPEPVATAPTAPQEPAKSDGDPMAGMTVVEAMQALVSEIQQKGVDMAAVNGRVRAKANELGLTYSSAACLIKAIGYVETRKVALGEK
jgi:outer membrane biosynthesis protein TonB